MRPEVVMLVVSFNTVAVGSAYQLKVTFVFATSVKFTKSLLQMVNVSWFNKANGGLTITVTVWVVPVHPPCIETGVTAYTTT